MKKERWVVSAKRADFQAIADRFGIDPVIARLIRNRDVTGEKEIEEYLFGDLEQLHNPLLMKDMERAADLIAEKIREKKPIRIIGDYDIDGVTATYILPTGLKDLGADVDVRIPDRIADGYGLNEHLVQFAADEGRDTIVTCDNGIAASSQIRLAKELGMTVVVTDHHEVPFEEDENGERRYILPPADAVVNPKQKDCSYPFPGLCGAAVAWKLIQTMEAKADIPKEHSFRFLEFVAIATIGDVMDLQGENRILVNRGYLHMVFHCIFRHFGKPGIEKRLWNLSCDIAVEHMIDGIYHRSVRYSRSLLRRETYRLLEKEKKTLNAERIYKLLKEEFLKEKELARLEKEFYVDDHKYWVNQQPNQKPNPLMSKKWGDISDGIETDLETFSRESGEQDGDFLDQLKIENRERYDYREFLRKFAVFREELTVDPDSFDYNFYTYGLSLYGNMPLIEPLETREVKKVSEFVIVIDTSMSCSGELVQRFLEETYGILSDSGNFFQKVNIHIIQCDEKVHSDVKITGAEELQEYMNSLELYGDGGTDFRPAFAYVEELMEKREYENLKGLVYFTDGYGLFPAKMPPYRTAFVFMEQEPEDVDIPAWAMKLVITEEEL